MLRLLGLTLIALAGCAGCQNDPTTPVTEAESSAVLSGPCPGGLPPMHIVRPGGGWIVRCPPD